MTLCELNKHIFDAYSVTADHPFRTDGDIGVFRHADNRKWFAVTMYVSYRRLGLARDGGADVVNVKCDPLVIGSLRGRPGFQPAYHMNKDRWITILLDGSAERAEIEALLAMSYDLTASKRPRRAGAGL